MKKFLLWLKSIRIWLNKAKHFWLATAVVAASFIWIYTSPCEPSIRITGLVLQIFGIATVAWGIRETRKLFNHPSFLDKAIDWIKQFPPYGGRILHGSGSGSFGTMFGQAHIQTHHPIDPNSSIEDRLNAITKNITIINTRISQVEIEFDTKTKSISESISLEKSIREEALKEAHNKIESANTGGLHISAMGAFWLFIGVSLSTASVEISKYII